MTTPLLDNQKQAIEKLRKLKVGALFMAPGTGKTRTAIELLKTMPVKFVLWITPCQTKENLKAELEKWGFDIDHQILGTETLSFSDNTYIDILDLLKKYDKNELAIVLDESLKIKNHGTIRSKRVIHLGELADYKLTLNGSPYTKNILDLWAQLQFLSPKILNMTYSEYLNHFVEYIKIENPKKKDKMFIKSFENIDVLFKIIKPFIFECGLNLPISEEDHDLHFDITENIEEYYHLKSRLLKSISNSESLSFLSTTQLMQMSYSCDKSKIEEIQYLVDDKTIIFCKYVKTKEKLMQKFEQAKVLTYGKGSFGLNLQSYNKIIFFDQTWDYAQLDQAKHRIYRVGQKDNVQYFHLIGNVGLENMIRKNILKKVTLINYFNALSKDLDPKYLIEKLEKEL